MNAQLLALYLVQVKAGCATGVRPVFSSLDALISEDD